ncbi:MAG: hypothetical protein QOE40_3375 [Actinomycetota bacterium]|nr:hypothetical protein [Actinomycetota bacterium]
MRPEAGEPDTAGRHPVGGADLRVDTTPSRLRELRLPFVAGTVAYLGGTVTCVALPHQIYQPTGSKLRGGAGGEPGD